MKSGFFNTSKILNRSISIPNIPLCGRCMLHKSCVTPRMQPTGEGRKKILFVAEAPGRVEDERGIQLVGKAGQKLRSILKSLNVDLDRDCWKTNAVICRPSKNKTPDDEKISSCVPNLFRTIRQYSPNVIILLGNVACQSLIGTLRNDTSSSLGMWLGWTIPSQYLNMWICPTYHPSYLVRSSDPLLDKIFTRHLKYALKKAPSKPWESESDIPKYEKEVEVIYKPSRAVRRLSLYKEGLMAFDYESNCLKPEYIKSEIVSCSVCWNGRETIAFPWTSETADAMANILFSPAIGKIGSNIKFEDRWTRHKLGRSVVNWVWDTMLAAHVLDNRPRITGLKFQSFVLLGQQPYNTHIESLLETTGKDHLNRIHEIDTHDLLLYNGMDSLLEFKVGMVQRKKMKYAGA